MAGAETGPGVSVGRSGDYWRAPTVAQAYDRVRFDNLWGRVYRWREENAIRQALRDVQPGSTVLDAACGTGRVTALLCRVGFRATACDISMAMMAVARQRLMSLGYDIPFVATDAQHLPYPTRSFDVATCVGLLMHLDAEARVGVLRQLARVARHGVLVQHACIQPFTRAAARISGRPPANVRYAVSEPEMRMDLERAELTERARFWVLRGFSSSVVQLLSPA
jgi:ubiquinone/menaquinone biosynthesis C-methylase UbiE